jgi:hypothetical protein
MDRGPPRPGLELPIPPGPTHVHRLPSNHAAIRGNDGASAEWLKNRDDAAGGGGCGRWWWRKVRQFSAVEQRLGGGSEPE